MEEKIDLTKGGIAVVACMAIGYVKEYANHPSVVFLDCKSIKNEELESRVPQNVKAVILTDGLPQWHYAYLTSLARRRNIPFLVRKSTQHIYETLKGFFPNGGEAKPTLEEIKDEQSKGKLTSLIPYIEWGLSNAENARKLMRICREKNIKSTEASLAQWMANQRRKHTGVTAVPRSARPQLDVSVELLDNMIKDLSSMRDYLIATTEENRLLKSKLERFKKAMED